MKITCGIHTFNSDITIFYILEFTVPILPSVIWYIKKTLIFIITWAYSSNVGPNFLQGSNGPIWKLRKKPNCLGICCPTSFSINNLSFFVETYTAVLYAQNVIFQNHFYIFAIWNMVKRFYFCLGEFLFWASMAILQ